MDAKIYLHTLKYAGFPFNYYTFEEPFTVVTDGYDMSGISNFHSPARYAVCGFGVAGAAFIPNLARAGSLVYVNNGRYVDYVVVATTSIIPPILVDLGFVPKSLAGPIASSPSTYSTAKWQAAVMVVENGVTSYGIAIYNDAITQPASLPAGTLWTDVLAAGWYQVV